MISHETQRAQDKLSLVSSKSSFTAAFRPCITINDHMNFLDFFPRQSYSFVFVSMTSQANVKTNRTVISEKKQHHSQAERDSTGLAHSLGSTVK